MNTVSNMGRPRGPRKFEFHAFTFKCPGGALLRVSDSIFLWLYRYHPTSRELAKSHRATRVLNGFSRARDSCFCSSPDSQNFGACGLLKTCRFESQLSLYVGTIGPIGPRWRDGLLKGSKHGDGAMVFMSYMWILTRTKRPELDVQERGRVSLVQHPRVAQALETY